MRVTHLYWSGLLCPPPGDRPNPGIEPASLISIYIGIQHSKNKDHGIRCHHFMANRDMMKTVTDFIFLGSRITADGDCSHEIKRHLRLGRKAMTNLDSVLKSRDVTLLTKVHRDKAIVFPVDMYGCESWSIKKAECQRIDAFDL